MSYVGRQPEKVKYISYTHGTATGDSSTVAFTISSGRLVADVLVHVN